MNTTDTIAEVAQKVLQDLGRAASLDEIYADIVERKLYLFNTPNPEHVLQTAIHRQAEGSERMDASDDVLFKMVGDNVYALSSDKRTTTRKRTGSGMKRIQRANDKEEIIKSLMSENVGVFKEIWKLLLFAAQVGMRNDNRKELKAVDAGKGIDQSTFGNCPAWPGVLYLMTLAETKKSDCLSGTAEADDDRVAVFQEYANGGLEILRDFFAGRPLDLDGLIAFIETQREESAGRLDLDIMI